MADWDENTPESQRVKETYLSLRQIFPEWTAEHTIWAVRKAIKMNDEWNKQKAQKDNGVED